MSDWSFRYENYEPKQERLREALCTVGNGYFATRGAAPESKADKIHYPGTYVAGCYNRLETVIQGHKLSDESLVNVPNWLSLTFSLGNGKWFDLKDVKILRYLQELDLRKGLLTRIVRFSDDKKRITRLVQRRFVNMEDPHLAGLETTLLAENWSGRIKVLSALDGTVTNAGVERYQRFRGDHLLPDESSAGKGNSMFLSVKTSQSKIRISEVARTEVLRDGRIIRTSRRSVAKPRYVSQEFTVNLQKGKPVTVEKVVALYTSKDMAISECGYAAKKKILNSPRFIDLLDRHILRWDHLWKRFRMEVEGDERGSLALHAHIFHLLQTVSPNSIDLDVGVPARGLHGEAYRGHIFWDELFIFPFLNLHVPDLTRSLLLYRYRRLPEARSAAISAGFKGAMFPWQSGSVGRDESVVIHLNPLSNRWVKDNSHLQRHINVAIAYNVWSYYQVSNDMDFLAFYGAEMIIEIARFFSSAAQHNKARDRYEKTNVMGPDEYHDGYPRSREPGLNNNAYTNIMAVWVFCRALEVLELIPRDRSQILRERLGLGREELVRWEDVSRKMFVPFDHGIISQFEGYEKLKEFDWEGYGKKYGNIQRLDRILEAEGDSPNNYKASKQADVLMLFYLLSSEELSELFNRLRYEFSSETIRKNVDYYIRRTSHGSTLSRVVHSWLSARVNREESLKFFRESLESDLSDIQGGTTAEGIHVGAMSGSVDIVSRCYVGVETRTDILRLNPCLPPELSKVLLTILYRGHTIDLELGGNVLEITSSPGPYNPIKVAVRDEIVDLKPGERKQFSFKQSKDI